MEAKATTTLPVRLDLIDDQGKTLQTAEFVKDKIVIGRILSADFRIDDPRVSRIHALIEVRGENVLVTDLASTHGTFVNAQKVVESKLKFGDQLTLGSLQVKVSKGSGKVTQMAPPSQRFTNDQESTQIDLKRPQFEPSVEKRVYQPNERRQKDVFPEERRLDDRRQGERRVEERVGQRRKAEQTPPENVQHERRSNEDRRQPMETEQRTGEDRRLSDRRVFDITSLERRIEDRRTRRSDDDILTEDLEKAFETPDHARELEVTVMWGDHILDVSNFYEPTVLSCGESPDNHYIIPSEGIPDEFPLITIEDDGNAYLSFTEDMTGTVRARDKIYTLDTLRNEKFVKKVSNYFVLGLKQDDFAKVNIGKINFFALYVKPAPRIMPAPMFDKDPLLFRTALGSVVALALLFLAVSLVPKPKPVTIEMIPERFAKIVIKPKPKIPPAKTGIVAKGEENKQGGSKMGEGGRPMGEEGKVGKAQLPDKKEVPQAVMPKSTPKEKPEVAKPKAPPAPERKVVDKDKAKSVGLLKAFTTGGVQKDLKALIDKGTGPEGTGGFDDFGKAVSGLRGKSIEETGGAGGKGLKGIDAGGGGKTVGIDGPSTKGLGRGYHGDGIGEGIDGPGRLGIKGEHSISIISENVQVLSGLPKDVINAVVQRHRSEIRACYDAALQRNPSLRGKVSIAFNIQPNGIVSYAGVKESSIGDSGLEGCIVSRVKTWVFPKPEAPVVTEVTAYPFYLNPAN